MHANHSQAVNRKPRILVIGGGSGVQRVLKGLFSYDVSLQAGVTIFDNGGDAGFFRIRDNCPSFGDIARAIVPFSPRTSITNRFERPINFEGGVHKVRNIKSSQLYHACDKDFGLTIDRFHEWLNTSGGEAIPASLKQAHLYARLENGEVICGETKIDVPEHDGTKRIAQIWLEPSVPANPRFLRAIADADMIVFSIGDLHTSVFAAMLPEGVKTTIMRSRAEKVLMLNLMTKYGETYRFRLEDFVEEYARFFNGVDVIDRILVNSTIPSAHAQALYRDEHANWIWVDPNKSVFSDRLAYHPLLARSERARHDPVLIGQAFATMFPDYFPSMLTVTEKVEAELMRA